MPLYVTLGKYTTEAMRAINEVPERFQQNRSLIEARGGKLVAVYGLLGEWDLLAISAFPDEKSAMSTLLSMGKAGRITTQTMTAVSMDDFINLAKNA